MVGACLPHPHMKDVKGLMESNVKRIMGSHPDPEPTILIEVYEFVKRYIQRYKPLSRDQDFSVEGWLDQSNYTMQQKAEIREAYAECLGRVDDTRTRMNNKS